MKSILFSSLLVLASVEAEESLSSEEFNTRHAQAVDAVERKYPEAKVADSAFSVLMDYKFLKAKHLNDPILKDPYFPMQMADALAKEMREIGMFAEPDAQQEPAQTSIPENVSSLTPEQIAERAQQQAAKEGDIQAYFAQVEKGHAGVDPKLQTRARSGDLYAQAEIDRNTKLSQIRAKVAAGHMSTLDAQTETAATNAAYAAALQQIQNDASLKKQTQLLQELQRQRQENQRDRRKYQR